MKAQLASFLESIMTHIIYYWTLGYILCVKMDEQRRYYANKLSYEDVEKKKEIPKGSICALFKKHGE